MNRKRINDNKEILECAIHEMMLYIVGNGFSKYVIDIHYYGDSTSYDFKPEIWIGVVKNNEKDWLISRGLEKIRKSFYDSDTLHIKDIVYYTDISNNNLNKTNYRMKLRNYNIDNIILQ